MDGLQIERCLSRPLSTDPASRKPGTGGGRVAGGQTWAEHFSEALGHVIWLWSIELVRRDVRNRITHQPDPWVPLDAEPAR